MNTKKSSNFGATQLKVTSSNLLIKGLAAHLALKWFYASLAENYTPNSSSLSLKEKNKYCDYTIIIKSLMVQFLLVST